MYGVSILVQWLGSLKKWLKIDFRKSPMVQKIDKG
jgi:hypothetical protein